MEEFCGNTYFLKGRNLWKKRVKLIVLLIELLIRQAKEYEKKDEEKIAKKSFGSFFSIVVYPIIAGISGIIVKNISDEQIVTLGITVMFLLIFAFALYSIIYPEIKKNENKYKIIATDMRADLELIMNELKKAEN